MGGPRRPWQPLGWPGTEVGWGVIRSVWGKGYAYETSVAAMDFAVDYWGGATSSTRFIRTTHDPRPSRPGSDESTAGPASFPQPYESDTVEIWGQTSAQWKKDRPH